MTNDSETVREVCANCEVFDAYERFKAAKDAEIARLKAALKPVMACDLNDADLPYREVVETGYGNHHKNCCCALYGSPLKGFSPIFELNIKNKIKEFHSVKDSEEFLRHYAKRARSIKDGMNAVREAQRIMKEGENHD